MSENAQVIITASGNVTEGATLTALAAAGSLPNPARATNVARFDPEKVLYRDAAFDAPGVNASGRTCDMSISSETPVKRYDWIADREYNEVLSHDAADVDMSRIASGSHPLLLQHDRNRQIGIVQSAKLGSDKKIRATTRFSKSDLGEQIWTDVKDGIRRLVSVGYRITREVSSEMIDGVETVRFAWQPYEASIVSIPADTSVGIGRAETLKPEPVKTKLMSETATVPAAANIAEVEGRGVQQERTRIKEIQAINKNFAGKVEGIDDLCAKAIAEGTNLDNFRADLIGKLPGFKPVSQPTLELSSAEVKRYSIAGAILSACKNGGHARGFEGEISDELAKQTRKPAEGFYIPNGILYRADNLVGVNTMGGFLKATELLAGDFISVLRNKAKVAMLGARMLPGLVGDVVIPRQDGTAVGYWATETEAATQSNTNFGQVTLTPKCLTTYEVYSKKLLAQSTPAIDGLIRDDMLAVLALGIDLASLHGTGANAQPTGIASTTGIVTVACGTNGAIPTFANIISLESQVASQNADLGSLAYLTNALVRGALKSVVKSTLVSGFVWEQDGNLGAGGAAQGMMNGYRAEASNQVAGNLTKGTNTTVCSAIFFGNWNDLLIGQWGGTDIVVDPFTLAANREVRIFAHTYVDINVRHPRSFSVIIDALTS